MELVKIKDITGSNRALSAIDGAQVYDKILGSLRQKRKVTLDFRGIDLTITAFLNASIGKLYSEFSPEEIKSLLEIKNLHSDEIHLLKIVIDRAKERFNKEFPSELDSEDLIDEN